jgi:hypothetical protein
MGPHNITMGSWELSLNLSLYVQLLDHLVVIFKEPTERELNDE